MEVFRAELTLRPEDIGPGLAQVLEDEGDALAFYTLRLHGGGVVELEHLFVDPPAMRRGAGRRLFDHALGRARALAAARLTIQSDPNAEGFYRALGHAPVRRIPSSIPGREIPLFEIEIAP